MSQKEKLRKKRKPRYDALRKAEVIARKAQGESERGISRALKMSRNTVSRITSDEEYNAIIEHYRRQATKLIDPSLRILERALLLEDEPAPPPEKFEKITVIGGKDLQKRLTDAYKRGYRRGLRSGTDSLKAAISALGGTQIFTSRQQTDLTVKPADGIDKLTDDQLDASILAAEQRLKEAKASEGEPQ